MPTRVESVETPNGSAAESLRLSYSHARDAASQVCDNVKDRAADLYQKGKEKASDLTDRTEEMVREHPMKSVLIAAAAGAAAGLALGLIFRRR